MKFTGNQVIHIIGIIRNVTPQPLNAFTLKRANEDNQDSRFATYSYDWHEYSNLLDMLNTIGLLIVFGHNTDGMTQYRLNQP